jgi:serine/threonine-protein kinase HipA
MTGIEKIDIWAWGNKIATVIEEGNKLSLELEANKYSMFSPAQFDGAHKISSIAAVHEIGLIGDAIPGAYGSKYLNRFFKDEFGRSPSVVETLAFIGSHGLGAIEFKPSSEEGEIDSELILTINELKMQSRRIYEGEHNIDIAKLIAVSNSAIGGARAKAAVGFNPANKKVYIGQKHASLPAGYKKCIVKFNSKEREEVTSYNEEIKGEYLYYKMAKALGLTINDCWLIEEDGVFHFATERFDIDKHGNRLHMHSFAGLIGSDASSFSTSYDALFRVANRLCVCDQDKAQMFKSMAFNLVFGNRDDHARNFSFLMTEKGEWSFSPAYDLTFSSHDQGGNKHQLKIGSGFADAAKMVSIAKAASIIGINNSKEIFEEFIDFKHENLAVMSKEIDIDEKFYKNVFNDTAGVDKALGKNVEYFTEEENYDKNRNPNVIRR